MELRFMEPEWLVALLAIPVILYLYLWAMRRGRKVAIKFSNINLIKRAGGKKAVNRERILLLITLVAITSLIIALSDPHLPLEQTKEGVNVVLAIDVSGSMQAPDYKPNRLEAAKSSAGVLIGDLDIKDNVGIVIFSDGATTSSYLTPFKDKAAEKLKAVGPPNGQTAIGDGLSLAIDMATSIPNKKRIVILLSDGENNAGVISPAESIEFAKTNEIQVYTIGIGSEEPVVLGYDFFGRPQYANLDEETLRRIAQHTEGQYFKAVDENTLQEIYKNIPETIKREEEFTSVKDYFVVLAALFMLIGFYLRYFGKRILQ
ncbi:MAG: VWA domain-containing protein [Candidatus Altiarchaeales archaeon]|nr:VWA domain-containing protein [Candidatus Altiarchaeales archaeon]